MEELPEAGSEGLLPDEEDDDSPPEDGGLLAVVDVLGSETLTKGVSDPGSDTLIKGFSEEEEEPGRETLISEACSTDTLSNGVPEEDAADGLAAPAFASPTTPARRTNIASTTIVRAPVNRAYVAL